MDQLDIRYDPYTRQYQAPLQLKASNGMVHVIDSVLGPQERAKQAEAPAAPAAAAAPGE